MNQPDPLPEHLALAPFTFREARNAGLRRSRLGRADVVRAHHGLYVPGVHDSDIVSRCEALLPLLGTDRWYSHGTAARLQNMPLPLNADTEPLHVLSLAGAARMRRPGVIGWETSGRDVPRSQLGLLPAIEPATVWCQLAIRGATIPGVLLTPEWLVAVGDYLLTGPRRYGRHEPLCSRTELLAAVASRAGQRGAASLSWAVTRVRRGADSPKETQLRLGLVACGLPEPQLQVPVQTVKGLKHADLGYPQSRLLLEYQGDDHRTSRKRWLEDLTRVQLFQDAGYRVMLVGADDVDDAEDVGSSEQGGSRGNPRGFGSEPGPGLRALAERVRRALG